MSVTILMDPGKMLTTARSLIDAAGQTRGSANALGALSSPPPGVPASVAGRVTGATNRAKGALERQATLIESLAHDLKTRAAFAYAADVVGQVTGLTGKVAGLARGVGQAGRRYESRQRITHDLRKRGMAPNKIRDEVDRRMAKQYGVMGLSVNRQRQLEKIRPVEGPNGQRLSRVAHTARASLAAPSGGLGPRALRDIGGYLKKSPTGPLAAGATAFTHGSTVANPNLTRGQKAEQIADDTASGVVGAAPALAAGAAFGGPVGIGVAAVTIGADAATGGKVTEVSNKIGEGLVEDGKNIGEFTLGVGQTIVRGAERVPGIVVGTGETIVRGATRVPGVVVDAGERVHRGADKVTPWDGVAPW